MIARKLVRFLFAIVTLTMTAVSCSKDDATEEMQQSGKVLNVSIDLSTEKDFSKFADAYVMCYVNGEITAKQIELGKEFKTQVASTHPTDTLGFVIYFCTKPDIADGTYEGKYSLVYTAKLTEDGIQKDLTTTKINDKKFKAEIDSEQKLTEEDLIIHHQYTIKNNLIDEVIDTPKFDDNADEDRVQTPATDVDNLFHYGNMYYYTRPSSEYDANTMTDNLAARFSGMTKWDSQQLSYGDLLYIKGEDVAGVNKTVLKDAANNGTVIFMDGGKQQLTQLCNAIDIPCLITPDCDDDMFIIAKGADRDGQSVADPIFVRLTPHDVDGNLLDDYNQGKEIDMALNHVQTYLGGIANNATPRLVLKRSGEPTQILNQLVSAYRVSLFLPQTISREDYRKKNLSGLSDNMTNLYEVNYSIWNVFNIDQKINFYYVHQELNAGFSPCYWNVYNKSVSGIAKVCEWYGRNVKTRLEPYNTQNMHIENSSPATTSGSTTFTSGISYGISGTVGYSSKQGATASVSASLSFSSSTSYSVPDVIVYNRCLPGQKFEWEYDLADVTSSFSLFSTACTNLRPGAAPGRSTLVAGADYMFSFPESSGQPQMKATLEVLLRSSCSKCGYTCKVRDKLAQKSTIFNLPYLKTSDFQQK